MTTRVKMPVRQQERDKNTMETSIPPVRDLVENHRRRCEEETEARQHLELEADSSQAELANVRRRRQWLESRRQESEGGRASKGILALTAADIAAERRLCAKLEETLRVMERARAIEGYRTRSEDESRAASKLRATIDATRAEIAAEGENVRAFELDAATEGPLSRLEAEFTADVEARRRLERQLSSLEEAITVDTPPTPEKTPDNDATLERLRDELEVERRLRERLETRLLDAEAAGRARAQDEASTLQGLLGCTLDKLTGERGARKTLEERLVSLETAVRKEQARTRFEEVFLELTQNELVEEREARKALESRLAEIEDEGERKRAEKEAEESRFDARLEALDKIIAGIQEQTEGYEEELVEVELEPSLGSGKEIKVFSPGGQDIDSNAMESKGSEGGEPTLLCVTANSAVDTVTVNIADYPRIETKDNLELLATKDYLGLATQDCPELLATKDYPELVTEDYPELGTKDYPELLVTKDDPEFLATKDYPELVTKDYPELGTKDYPELLVTKDDPELLETEDCPEFLATEDYPELVTKDYLELGTKDYLELLVTKDDPELLATEDCPEFLATKDYPKLVTEDYPELETKDYLELLVTKNDPELLATEDCPELVTEHYLELLSTKDCPELLATKAYPELDPKDNPELRTKDYLELSVTKDDLELLVKDCPELLATKDYTELLTTEDWPEFLEQSCCVIEPAPDQLVVVGTSISGDKGRWHVVGETARDAGQEETRREGMTEGRWDVVGETARDAGQEETRREGETEEKGNRKVVEPATYEDNQLEVLVVPTGVKENGEVCILEATREVTRTSSLDTGRTESTEETSLEPNGAIALQENEAERFTVKEDNLICNVVRQNTEKNILEAAQDVSHTTCAMGNPDTTPAQLHTDGAPQFNGIEDFEEQTNALCNSAEVNIEGNILDAAEDVAILTPARTENTKQILARLNEGTTLLDGDKPCENPFVLAKPVGIKDQDLEEKLTELGAIKKTHIEKQPDVQQNNKEELPSVYE